LVYGPGADSGTFDYFNEVIVAPLYPDAAGKADIAAGKAALLGSAAHYICRSFRSGRNAADKVLCTLRSSAIVLTDAEDIS